jgi:hypothetical protein
MFDFQQRYSCKVIIKDEDYFLDVVTIKEKGSGFRYSIKTQKTMNQAVENITASLSWKVGVEATSGRRKFE